MRSSLFEMFGIHLFYHKTMIFKPQFLEISLSGHDIANMRFYDLLNFLGHVMYELLNNKSIQNVLSNGFGVFELKRLRSKNGNSHFNSHFLFLSILSIRTIYREWEISKKLLMHFCKSNSSFSDVNLAKWQ